MGIQSDYTRCFDMNPRYVVKIDRNDNEFQDYYDIELLNTPTNMSYIVEISISNSFSNMSSRYIANILNI